MLVQKRFVIIFYERNDKILHQFIIFPDSLWYLRFGNSHSLYFQSRGHFIEISLQWVFQILVNLVEKINVNLHKKIISRRHEKTVFSNVWFQYDIQCHNQDEIKSPIGPQTTFLGRKSCVVEEYRKYNYLQKSLTRAIHE